VDLNIQDSRWPRGCNPHRSRVTHCEYRGTLSLIYFLRDLWNGFSIIQSLKALSDICWRQLTLSARNQWLTGTFHLVIPFLIGRLYLLDWDVQLNSFSFPLSCFGDLLHVFKRLNPSFRLMKLRHMHQLVLVPTRDITTYF
jgi:hypothetical protein